VGRAFLERGETDVAGKVLASAAGYFSVAVDIAPNFWEGWYGLALIHSMMRRREECFSALEKLFELRADMKEQVASAEAFSWLRSDPEFLRLVAERNDNGERVAGGFD